MTSLEKMVSDLDSQINADTTLDPQIRELYLQILGKIKMRPLPNEPSGRSYLNSPGKEEQIKTEFIFASADIGGKIASQNLDEERLYGECREFTALLRSGMEAIGQDIGINYARLLYPELRRLRDQGEKLPFTETPADKNIMAYSFTLRHYRNRFELGPMIERDTLWDSFILYDKQKECFTEEFAFKSLSQADAMHGAWERYISGKTHRPPVKYCLAIRHNPNKTFTVLSVTHARFTDKNSREIEPDGSCLERIIFDNPFEAEAKRDALSKEETKALEQKKQRKIPQSQKKNKSKEKTPRQIMSHRKEQPEQLHEAAAQTQPKGRSV